MNALEPIDPFLRELRLAQATGQRVLAAAAQRPGAAPRRGGTAQRSGELPMPTRDAPSGGRHAEQRAG